MNDFDAYRDIYVFKDRRSHVLILDLMSQYNQKIKQYFDLHLCKFVYVQSNSEKDSLILLDGEIRNKACEIYMRWKWIKDRAYVAAKMNEHFPVSEPEGVRLQEEKLQQNETPSANNSRILIQNIYPKNIHPINPEMTTKDVENRNKVENRIDSIKKIIEQKKILSLIHFTPITNLPSILEHGLLSRRDVDNLINRSSLLVNDSLRLDGYKEAVCLSISFPNYRMFYKYRSQDEENLDKWVVIGINPEILWKFNCAFCSHNAASNEARFIYLEERKDPRTLESLFDDYGDIRRATLNIPGNYTTNPQAEVLVFDSIPVTEFQKIYFNNIKIFNTFLNENYIEQNSLFEVNPFYFNHRKDHRYWGTTQPENSFNINYYDYGDFERF